MKILHICLGCFYPDNYTYQENMIPKFHKKYGYDVEVVASLETFDKNGKKTYSEKIGSYFNEYNIKVTRLDYKKPKFLYHKFKRYKKTFETINQAKPDIIFIHGCQFLDAVKVKKYVKENPNTIVYVDNHADFSNSARNWFSKNILHKIIWKRMANILNPYVKKFYGVLPARVDFLKNVYKLPSEKCELLVMGADDDLVEKYSDDNLRKNIKKDMNIGEDEFIIVTGGKIDNAKLQTLLLMQAVSNINNKKIKLLIFGSVALEIKNEFDKLCDGNKIKYLGWVDYEQSYKYFSIADLVIFPGRHSVYWEQVVAMGKPLICKYWDGTTHVDIGGNVRFLKEDSVDVIEDNILEIMNNKNIYDEMKFNANKKEKADFLYGKIALKCIEK